MNRHLNVRRRKVRVERGSIGPVAVVNDNVIVGSVRDKPAVQNSIIQRDLLGQGGFALILQVDGDVDLFFVSLHYSVSALNQQRRSCVYVVR